MSDSNLLFTSLTIGGVTLRNRVVVPPMMQMRPIASPEGLAWHRRLAAGGAAMVIVQATGTEQFGRELTADALRPLADVIHAEGAAAAVQLFPVRVGEQLDLNRLTEKELHRMAGRFGRAAAVCRDAGFDAVEPHGAHGYLLNQFFLPAVNRRDDGYGGSLENRGRMAVEIVHRIRKAVGDDLLVLYRHTPVAPEVRIGDSLDLAQRLVAAGVDVLDISPARESKPADLAAPFASHLSAPVIAVGGMDDPVAAAGALAAGHCHLVALGRQMIADATWPEKVREGRTDEIRRCTRCDECFDCLHRGEPVRCSLWPDGELESYMPAA